MHTHLRLWHAGLGCVMHLSQDTINRTQISAKVYRYMLIKCGCVNKTYGLCYHDFSCTLKVNSTHIRCAIPVIRTKSLCFKIGYSVSEWLFYNIFLATSISYVPFVCIPFVTLSCIPCSHIPFVISPFIHHNGYIPPFIQSQHPQLTFSWLYPSRFSPLVISFSLHSLGNIPSLHPPHFIIIKINSTCPSGKNKVVYKLLLQPHKHLHHGKLKKTQLREATNG